MASKQQPGGQALSEHARRAARTYGAAADHYTAGTLSFWDRFGAATVARLPLAPGHMVLDLCCGAGASAIPAARAVGPVGSVVAVDVAAPLVDLARTRAASEQVGNIEFRVGDATCTGLEVSAGAAQPEIEAMPARHDIGQPDRFWDVVLGTGYRATVGALGERHRDEVRERVLHELRSLNTTALRTDVLYGVARR